MNTATLSVIIAVSALVSSVVCPMLTVIINNHYQMKISNREYYDKHRAEVIEDYIRCAGCMTKYPDETVFQNYGKSNKEIYLYLPENLWNTVDCIEKSISNRDYDTASDNLSKLCKELNKYPPRLKKHGSHHNVRYNPYNVKRKARKVHYLPDDHANYASKRNQSKPYET